MLYVSCFFSKIDMATLWYQHFQSPQRNLSTACGVFNQIQPTNVYCIACAYKFPDLSALEEHACPAVSYICTCGMGFADHKEMLIHRDGHNDTTSLQSNHISIMKEKAQDVQMREMKLRMLERIDLAQQQAESPNVLEGFASPAPFSSHRELASPVQPVVVPPSLFKSPVRISVSSSLKTMPSRVLPMSPVATNVPKTGALVKLTLQFQPGVIIRTKTHFHGGGPFMCAACRVIFWTKKLLLEHVTHHTFTQVYGCQRCGRLLLGRSPLSSHHYCGTYYASHRDRFTSGHFVFNPVLDQRKFTMSRCPHCPASYFQPWHLKRHLKRMHMGKVVPQLPQLPQFPDIEAIMQKAVAPVMQQQEITKMKGWNMMNGMFKSTVRDRKMLQQTMANMLMAKKREPEALLEINPCVPKIDVAQRETLNLAERVEDLKQQGTNLESVSDKQALSHCRCVICGKNFNSTQMLGQHWCKRTLTLLRLEKLQSMPHKNTGAYRSSLSRPAPYSLAKRDSEEMVTLRLQTSHDTEIHEPALKTISGEPTESGCSSLFKSVAVQTKVEFDDGSYDAAINSCTAISSPAKF